MRFKLVGLACVAVWCAAIPVMVHADRVELNNGDRLTGVVDSISGGRLLLQTEYAGLVALELAAIASLDTEAEYHVRVDGKDLQGQFASGNGAVRIAEQEVDLTQVAAATQNNLTLAALGSEWASRADVSLVLSSGNSDTQSLNTLLESVYKRDRVRHSVSLLLSNEEAEDVTTKEQLDLDYGYRRFMSERWYLAGNAEYFSDELKDIDERITLGLGSGYQFWDNSLGALSTELGISFVREDLAGQVEENPALRWAVEYNRYLLAKRMEVFHRNALLVIPDGDRGQVLSSSSGVRFAVSSRIDTTARIDVNHETDPAPGASSTDVTYSLGLGIKF